MVETVGYYLSSLRGLTESRGLGDPWGSGARSGDLRTTCLRTAGVVELERPGGGWKPPLRYCPSDCDARHVSAWFGAHFVGRCSYQPSYVEGETFCRVTGLMRPDSSFAWIQQPAKSQTQTSHGQSSVDVLQRSDLK